MCKSSQEPSSSPSYDQDGRMQTWSSFPLDSQLPPRSHGQVKPFCHFLSWDGITLRSCSKYEIRKFKILTKRENAPLPPKREPTKREAITGADQRFLLVYYAPLRWNTWFAMETGEYSLSFTATQFTTSVTHFSSSNTCVLQRCRPLQVTGGTDPEDTGVQRTQANYLVTLRYMLWFSGQYWDHTMLSVQAS